MNINHLLAIIRMRWQMMINVFQKSGTINQVVTLILIIIATIGSLGTFVFVAGWGTYFLSKLSPFMVIYVWDALVVAFLFMWSIALLVELQRSELLSLKNLLHLPVSLSGAFFLNYTSSLASLTVMVFLPAMLGLCLASVLQYGKESFISFGLLIAFLFMVTAVSYQLRGWLARLMENKRTRGTVIVVTTIAFVMVFQLPTIFNLATMRSRTLAPIELEIEHLERLEALGQQQESGEISTEQLRTRYRAEVERFNNQQAAIDSARTAEINRSAKTIHAILPIGWLPYGAAAAAEGAILSPLLCLCGMFSIGLTSLTMAYRSTIRTYMGGHRRRRRRSTSKTPTSANRSRLEYSLPFLTSAQSATAMATFQSLLRAPEAKMALLTPLIFACIFGSAIVTGPIAEMPAMLRPWIGVGAISVSLFGMAQLMINAFGNDRQGFRAYVLTPVARRDILLGKNVGTAPIAGMIGAVLILFASVTIGMRFTHVVANLVQIIIAHALYFTISNTASILAPVGMVAGSMRPVGLKFSVVVIQMSAMLLAPLAVIPAALALAADLLVGEIVGIDTIPIYLLITLVELPIAILFYNRVLDVQGQQLQEREQTILEIVTRVAD